MPNMARIRKQDLGTIPRHNESKSVQNLRLEYAKPVIFLCQNGRSKPSFSVNTYKV